MGGGEPPSERGKVRVGNYLTREEPKEGWLTISCFCVCVCVLQVTWRANGIVLYMYSG